MNPFDWRGPEFLAFYLVFGITTVILVYVARQLAESHQETKQTDLSEPYLIACLRGGSAEVLRVATISLVDRGLLKASDDKVRLLKGNSKLAGKQPVERAVLDYFDKSDDPKKLLADWKAQEAAAPYEHRLRQLGYLPDRDATMRRLMIFLPALAALGLVAGIKIIIAIERGRNYSFLVVLGLLFPIVAAALAFPRQTRHGRRVLDDLKALFSGSRQIGATGNELLFATAVLGVAGLSTEHAWTRKLFPVSENGSYTSSGCGSSCGSSCGGGCGGGCGGCGS